VNTKLSKKRPLIALSYLQHRHKLYKIQFNLLPFFSPKGSQNNMTYSKENMNNWCNLCAKTQSQDLSFAAAYAFNRTLLRGILTNTLAASLYRVKCWAFRFQNAARIGGMREMFTSYWTCWYYCRVVVRV
jgi:hypothetical protein